MWGELTPADVVMDDIVFDVKFHPTDDLVASCSITGRVQVHASASHPALTARSTRYSIEDSNTTLLDLRYHKKPCRALAFSADGAKLYSASADRSLRVVDLETSKVAAVSSEAHANPINALCVTERFVLTGDDEGMIKCWDPRAPKCAWHHSEHSDFISDLVVAKHRLLATSGDGSMSVYNMNTGKLDTVSDPLEDELLSVTVIKDGQLAVCGSQSGLLTTFRWDEWGRFAQRLSGHPQSVETIEMLDEDTVITGSFDGMIRVVSIQPYSLVGVLGQHENFPIECVQLSPNKKLVASCSHDSHVKFWYLDCEVDEEGDDEEAGNTRATQQAQAAVADSSADAAPAQDLSMSSDSDFSDDDSDGGDSLAKPRKQPAKMPAVKSARKRSRKGFFKGL